MLVRETTYIECLGELDSQLGRLERYLRIASRVGRFPAGGDVVAGPIKEGKISEARGTNAGLPRITGGVVVFTSR